MSGVAKAGDYGVAKGRARSRVFTRDRRAKYALRGLVWILVGSEPLADYINTAEIDPRTLECPLQHNKISWFLLQTSFFLQIHLLPQCTNNDNSIGMLCYLGT